MSKLVTAKLILQVGSLQFLEAEGLMLFGKSVFYWKFKDSSTYYGPFDSLDEAGAHVDQYMRMPVTETPQSATPSDNSLTKTEESKNLIQVNFRTKKRLS